MLTTEEVRIAVEEGLMRVPEFRFIRREAEKLGVRVYLFGGTAAGYAHYAKWDALRKRGDPRYQPDRFDYDFTNIYRSTQDLDIVVDGPEEKANLLKATLVDKYRSFQGSKDAWDVRLLREKSGSKEALLNNPDYLLQHTDSNSTGMIEVTKTAREELVKDLRDWNARESNFLRDVASGRIHYYFSERHGETSRFKEGKNPPLFSVIRYLTKVFQYELEISPEDLKLIKPVIDQFDPKKLPGGYSAGWIEEHAKKLVRHAVDIEYAVDMLDALGLRKKLVAIRADAGSLNSLAWWLSREPLRSKPLGTKGRTAAQLGFDIVSHETIDFLAYESITRSHTGEPNALVSRQGFSGEAAMLGNGFYTRKGFEGARGTGLTIRFKMNPNAREGLDFTFEGDYVLILNRRALRVIPESLNVDLLGYFRVLEIIHESDRGVLEKLRRRLENVAADVAPGDIAKIREMVDERVQKIVVSPNSRTDSLLIEWFKFLHVSRDSKMKRDLMEDRRTWDSLHEALPQMKRDERSRALEIIWNEGSEGQKWVTKALGSHAELREIANYDRWLERIASNPATRKHLVIYRDALMDAPSWFWQTRDSSSERLIEFLMKDSIASVGSKGLDILERPEFVNETELLELFIKNHMMRANSFNADDALPKKVAAALMRHQNSDSSLRRLRLLMKSLSGLSAYASGQILGEVMKESRASTVYAPHIEKLLVEWLQTNLGEKGTFASPYELKSAVAQALQIAWPEGNTRLLEHLTRDRVLP
ncbi:MAG: hypothetical protein V4760_10185, partial [Bdellovibrionota bacterium]